MTNTDEILVAAFDLGGVMIEVRESIPISTFAEMSGRSYDDVFNTIFSPEKKLPIETGAITKVEHARRATEILGLDLDEQEFWRIHCTSHIPDTAVGEIITGVSSQRRITIASNLPSPHWDWVQENLQYSKKFEKPVLSFEIGVMKPDVGYYTHMINSAGVEAGRIFFTDDRPENVEAAQAAGIRAFQFDDAEKLRADLISCGITT